MAEKEIHPSEFLEFSTFATAPFGSTAARQDETNSSSSVAGKASPIAVEASADERYANMPVEDENLSRMQTGAFEASQSEHKMTFRQGLRLYPKAIGWSALLSLAIIMEGYDTALVNSFYAFTEFRRNYGIPVGNGEYQIPTNWQAALSNGSTSLSILGLLANGLIIARFGYRRTMMGALIALAIFIFLSFFAFNRRTLLASQILCGLPWGVFSTLTTTYAAEVMPLNLRVYLTSSINMCWLIGQIVAAGVLRGFIDWRSPWSYRIPFGLQWVWIVIVFIGVCFAPESPWWLIQHGRSADAEKVLKRLVRKDVAFNAKNTVAFMEHTNALERKFDAANRGSTVQRDNTSYLECFRGANLRRTEIACCIFVSQNLCGLPIIGYATYLYRQIGFNERQSFDINIGMTALGLVGNLTALVVMRHVGRRTMYLSGLAACCLILTTVGTISCFPDSQARLWAVAGLLMALIFCFDLTVGPMTYSIVAEIPSSRLRVKTVALARIAYNISGIITNVVIQHMLNPTAWNWRGKSAFFCAVTSAICFVYCFIRLPETRGLGYHELDILFEKGASARKFAKLQKVLEQNSYYSFYEEPETNGGAGGGGRKKSIIAIWR